MRCPTCGNETKGTREGDSEYCTTCGSNLGPATTPSGPELQPNCDGCGEPTSQSELQQVGDDDDSWYCQECINRGVPAEQDDEDKGEEWKDAT